MCYANAKHHRELIREHISPQLIDRIEISQNPSQNYKTAFKGVYMDQLERTLEEHKEKQQMEKSTFHQLSGQPDRASFHQASNTHQEQNANGNNSAVHSRVRRPFQDYEIEKTQKYSQMDKQQQQEHGFFKEQDNYQQRRKLELQANQFSLQQQMNEKERRRQVSQNDYQKENYEVKENGRRQLEYDCMAWEKSKEQAN